MNFWLHPRRVESLACCTVDQTSLNYRQTGQAWHSATPPPPPSHDIWTISNLMSTHCIINSPTNVLDSSHWTFIASFLVANLPGYRHECKDSADNRTDGLQSCRTLFWWDFSVSVCLITENWHWLSLWVFEGQSVWCIYIAWDLISLPHDI